MTLQFINLRVDVLLCIFSFLPLSELIACRYSCRRLRDIILGDMLSQRRIQSLERCTKDFSPPSRSTSDFLKNLEEMGMTSSTFRPREEVSTHTKFEQLQSFHKFTFFGDTETAFLLRSGYLIQVRNGQDPGWAYMDLLPEHDLQGDTPAPLEWKGVHLKGNGIMGWTLDLDQDLVAVSLLPYEDPETCSQEVDSLKFKGYESLKGNIEIRLIRFTTGTNHKSANKAAVQLDPLGFYDTEFKTHIAIMGGYLVVLLSQDTFSGYNPTGKYQTVYFVDWVKGHVIHKWRSIEDTYFPVLTSISKSMFVMGLKRDWALELCEITEKNGVSRIRTRRMLKLPAVQPGTHITLEKFDETSSVTGCPSALRRPSRLPFRVPPSDSVLAFYVGVTSHSGEKQKLLFSVFTSTLRGFTVTTKRTPWQWPWWRKRDTRPVIVPWDKWGPESTRWISVEDIPMVRALSGTRCVISERSTGQVRMLDFNPERLSWVEDWIKRGETVGRNWQVIASPTTIPAGKVFKHDIETKLPYYEVRKTGLRVEADSTFFIDDDWVVLIRPGKRH